MTETRATAAIADPGNSPTTRCPPSATSSDAVGRVRGDLIIPDSTDDRLLRRIYGKHPSGVVAVCALRDDIPVGMVASSFVGVSIDPPLVSVCVQHTSTTWPVLADRPRLGLSVLASTHGQVCRQIASRTENRFAGVGYTATDDGAVLLHGAAAWLACAVHGVVSAGDHDLVLLSVEAMRSHDGVVPLVFLAGAFRALTASTEPRPDVSSTASGSCPDVGSPQRVACQP